MTKILNNLNKACNDLMFNGAGNCEGVDYCDRSISIEDSPLCDLQYDNPDKFWAILEAACKGTGTFLEMENSCILTVVKG